MKNFKLLFPLYLLFFSTYLLGFDYEVSICAIFKDEAPYLQEWIEYHQLLGVQHFWLYNNNSSDHYEEVLHPYIQKGYIEVIDWPEVMNIKWTAQTNAYNDCIVRSKDITHWLAIIDIDEFIVPMHHDTLQDLLKNYQNVGGVQIFWQFFGTSGIYEIPPQYTLIESLTLKGPIDICKNYKTICQPHTVKKCGNHKFEYHEPWFAIFPNGDRDEGKLFSKPLIQLDLVQINHYWTRDEKHFRERKIPIKERINGKKWSEDIIQFQLNNLSQELDESILRFVPALKERLKSKQPDYHKIEIAS